MLIHETHLYCRWYNSILKLLYSRMHNAFPRVWNFTYYDMFEDLLLISVSRNFTNFWRGKGKCSSTNDTC